MVTPIRFGDYLLFQKGDTKPYGTSYRAGTVHGRIIDRVIRLEAFDGASLDRSRLLPHIARAGTIQSLLEDPHIAKGVGVGLADGVPYAAYDFELGLSLTDFLATAREQAFPVPFDQALFVAERISLALAAAYGKEYEKRPISHGFLTPDTILLSHDGSVKVFGFELGDALREQFGNTPPYDRYTAPEARAGEDFVDSDDVYSLGAILFELLAGDVLPNANVVELGDAIDQLTVVAWNEPAPEPIRRFLKSSLTLRGNRIPSVQGWQQALGRLILEGEYNPTTFNLAFLMHTLFRDRLEQDRADLKSHKSFRLAEVEITDVTGTGAPTEVPEQTEAGTEAAPEEVTSESITNLELVPEKLEEDADSASTETVIPIEAPVVPTSMLLDEIQEDPKRPFWLGFGVSAAVAAAVLVFFLVTGSDRAPEAQDGDGGVDAMGSSQATDPTGVEQEREASVVLSQVNEGLVSGEEPPKAPSATVRTPRARGDAPARTKVVKEVDEAEIAELVAQRTQEIENKLKAEYEKKLAEMESQEVSAQPDGAAPPDAPSDGDGPSETATPDTDPPMTAPNADAAGKVDGSPQSPTDPGSGEASGTPSADQPAATAERTNEESAGSPSPKTPQAIEHGAEIPEDGIPPPRATPAKRTPVKIKKLAQPVYPTAARRLGLSARVQVKVLVDTTGRTKEAEILGKRAGPGFDAAAISAVRKSEWNPATVDGDPIESWTVITIDFQP